MKVLVTGGAGFIGSALIRYYIEHTMHEIINVDKLTYAGNVYSLSTVSHDARYSFEQVDICSAQEMQWIFEQYQPDVIMNLAAESHVDRSIQGPADFIQTNIIGTYVLLETARAYWQSLPSERQRQFRFHHISTDEVYGDLDINQNPANEQVAYAPSSPYSASKASSDHLVRAWYRTYGFPVLITNCSNNYGPYQHPEKLIPAMIIKALSDKPLTIYGDGLQIRDWLYVEDHVRALDLVLTTGMVGETYNIGQGNEKKNIDIVQAICFLLGDLTSRNVTHYLDLITHVQDRPGHDYRYSIDSSKIKNELGWLPLMNFESGLRKTIQWYLDNQGWWNTGKRVCNMSTKL